MWKEDMEMLKIVAFNAGVNPGNVRCETAMWSLLKHPKNDGLGIVGCGERGIQFKLRE
jgi:hypothetical protein